MILSIFTGYTQNKCRRKVIMKRTMLYILSIAFLAVGILGLFNVSYFNCNTVVEIIETALGAVGLIVAMMKRK